MAAVCSRACAAVARRATLARAPPTSRLISTVLSRPLVQPLEQQARPTSAWAARLDPPARRRLHTTPSAAAAASASGDDRQVRVRHILLRPDQADVAPELLGRLQAGESFADLAAQHSACPSKREGGSLGWFGRGRMVPEFEAAAFGAGVGELVTCTTQFGTHILEVEGERQAASVQQMSVQELGELLAVLAAQGGGDDVQLVDVREEREHEVASLPGFRLLPLSQFQAWGGEIGQLLDPGKETVCLCHHGMRSMQMANFLVDQGFSNVKNVSGGIDAYSRAVDSNVPLY